MKPMLYLFVGYPGSGKTTIAKVIADATDGVHLWADFERHVMFGTPSHSRQESRALYDHLNQIADDVLSQGRCVIFDTNFNFRKDRDHMRTIAARHGADVKVVWVTTPRDVARYRATEDSTGKPTRIWGNMLVPDFNRLSDNLQEPDADEDVIRIDGSDVSPQHIKRQLGLA